MTRPMNESSRKKKSMESWLRQLQLNRNFLVNDIFTLYDIFIILLYTHKVLNFMYT